LADQLSAAILAASADSGGKRGGIQQAVQDSKSKGWPQTVRTGRSTGRRRWRWWRVRRSSRPQTIKKSGRLCKQLLAEVAQRAVQAVHCRARRQALVVDGCRAQIVQPPWLQAPAHSIHRSL